MPGAIVKVNVMRSSQVDIDGEYFVYVEFNVNLWSPNSIYYYNQPSDKLIELYTFNAEDVQGIHILSPEKLHELR